ncbi:hypothetical protein SS50377_25535 [Spironucleus salmonicida]|uniref:Uncharacterized protein n=1 Tax=Spironucleus salmonicida TaxID=348837 RepID=V6LL41_9EUKA|nr:hypothetical protein SS50377_25535 [Spironucleus salmonicida]|eukprot:EST45083.1 Hypothetical protein SS50377_15103 [Spironucleus salmonicida]
MERQYKQLQHINAKLLLDLQAANDEISFLNSVTLPTPQSNPGNIPALKAEISMLKIKIQEMQSKDYNTIATSKLEKIAHENQRENSILKHNLEQLNSTLDEIRTENKRLKGQQINDQNQNLRNTPKSITENVIVDEVEALQDKMVNQMIDLTQTVEKQSKIISILNDKYDKQEADMRKLQFQKALSAEASENEAQKDILALSSKSNSTTKSVIHENIDESQLLIDQQLKTIQILKSQVLDYHTEIQNLTLQQPEKVAILKQIIDNLNEKASIDDERIIQLEQQSKILKEQLAILSNDP